MKIKFKSIGYWTGWFIIYVGGIVALGAVVGSILYAIAGSFSHPDLHWTQRMLFGLRDGSQYAGVWAGGLSIVICFMKGHKQLYIASSETEESEHI